jgi:hypothetical protein
MIRFAIVLSIAVISFVASARAEEGIAEREVNVTIGVALSDSCAFAAPEARKYWVKHSSDEGTSFVKFETVQFPKGTPSPEVYLYFPGVESSSGKTIVDIRDVLDLSELPETMINDRKCYAILPGAVRYVKVLSRPAGSLVHFVPFEVVVRPPCCPPVNPRVAMNVTSTVIIGPDGFRLPPKTP